MPAPDNHLFIQGDDCYFYLNTGTNAAPVWVEIKNHSDLAISQAKAKATYKIHGSRHNRTRGGKFETSLSFNYQRARVSDAVYDALADSFQNCNPVQLMATDRAYTDPDAVGWKAWFEVFKHDTPMKDEEAVLIAVEAEPTDYVENGQLIEPAFI